MPKNGSLTMTRPDASTVAAEDRPTAWWRVGFVWLVVGGPLAVVVASLVTAAIAVSGAEEVLTDSPPGVSAQHGGKASVSDSAEMPAMQGRNHAATPRR
jgi:hypothetical protein